MHSFFTSPFAGAAVLWVVSAAISSMPDPDSSSSKGYRWLYGFAHAISANLDKVATAVKPPLK